MNRIIPIVQALDEAPRMGTNLRVALADMRRAWPVDGLTYRGPADFVLRHGTLKRGSAIPDGHPLGAPKRCYWNALYGALAHGWAYVEGFAAHPIVYAQGERAVPIPHAWNEDADGNVIDRTWPLHNYADLGVYMGVAFTAARAHDCTWHGNASVLYDPERAWGVLRDPWEGEASPGDVTGLVAVIARDMRAEGAEFARLGVELERAARAGGWPSA